jgi:ABC-type amino acid transport substrate-binding protein
LLLGVFVLFSAPVTAAEQEIVIFHPPANTIHLKLRILYDIFEMLEADLKVKFVMTDYPWKRAIQMAQEGQGGIIPFSKNAERLQLFDYSDEIFRDDNVLVVLKGREFPFQRIEDLQGKTLGYLAGASVGEEFERGRRDIFISDVDHAGSSERLKKLLFGRIDAAMINLGAAGLRAAIESDEELKRRQAEFVILPRPLVSDPNYLGFAKSRKMQPFLDEFNRALTRARQDGRMQKVLDKYAPE